MSDIDIIDRIARIETRQEHMIEVLHGMRDDFRRFGDSCQSHRGAIHRRIDDVSESATISRVKLTAFVSAVGLLWALVVVWFKEVIAGRGGL